MFKSGGNVQRENHMNKAAGGKSDAKGEGKVKSDPDEGTEQSSEAEGTTTMQHMPGGAVKVQHADGEESEHPSMAHAAMALHAKHEVGPAMHVHNHGGAPMHDHAGMEGHHMVTTHHVGHEGTVEGPHHHENMDAAAEHMKGSIGDGGGAMPHEAPAEQAGGGAASGGGRAPLY